MPPSLGNILLDLLGGLALFVLGMSLMTQALNALAGSRMKTFLAAFTRNRFAAALTGAAVTAAAQSSSVTTVLLVGFSSVGLISVAQSVGVIFGANVGSTITAQIIAFNVANAGSILLAVGVALSLARHRERLAQLGLLVLGLGAIFVGMQQMGDATRPLRSYQPFLDAMQTIQEPLWGIAIGLLFTAIAQSSAATIGLAIIFANQHFLTLEGAIAIAFGANIGTCVTAALAAIGRPAAAWRVVIIHVFFNLAGVVIWFAFIPQLATASDFVSNRWLHDQSLGRDVAIAHSLFNIANLALFIGFTGPIARLALWLAPDRASTATAAQPIYLDPIFLDTPALAIDRARLETTRLAGIAIKMAEDIPAAAIRGDAVALAALSRRDDELDDLQTAILGYLAKIDAAQLRPNEQATIQETIALANIWENIGDLLDTHVIDLGRDRLDTGLAISSETRQSLEDLHQSLLRDLRLAERVTAAGELADIETLLAAKTAFNAQAEAAETALQRRLLGRDQQRLELFRLESDLISNLKHLHHFARRPAKLLYPQTNR